MQGPPLQVVDSRLAAGRGEEFRVEAMRQRQEEDIELQRLDDGDFRLPMARFLEENVDLDETECASLETAIPASNVGYRLLQRMGWQAGGGLGRQRQGIVEPVRLSAVDSGTRVGLGRAEVERQFIAAEFVERRALEVELQADEDEDRRRKREMEAERQQKIREEVKHELRMFYCEICRKQYQFAHEMEEHLSSYDHHHRKRLAETRAMLSERNKKERGKKERRRAEKEAARLAAQVRAAQAAAGIQGPADAAEAAPPPPPDDGEEEPPPLPPEEAPAEEEGGEEGASAGGWQAEPGEGSAGGWQAGAESAGGGWQSADADQPSGWQNADEGQPGGWQAADGGEERGGWGGGAQPAGHGQDEAQQPARPKALFVSGGWQAGTMEGGQAAAPALPPPPPVAFQQQQQQQPSGGAAAAGAPGLGAAAAAAEAAAYDPFAADVDMAPGEAPPLPPLPSTAAAVGAAPPLPPPPSAAAPPLPPAPPAAAGALPLPPLPPAAAEAPPPPPPAAAVQPPARPGGISLSLGAAPKKPVGGFSLGGGAGRGRGRGLGGRAGPAGAAKRSSVFDEESDEEEG